MSNREDKRLQKNDNNDKILQDDKGNELYKTPARGIERSTVACKLLLSTAESTPKQIQSVS